MQGTSFINTDEVPWTDPPPGFYLTDVKEQILWHDESTGALMIIIKAPVGLATPVHCHPDANQWVLASDGEVETATGKLVNLKGTFSFVPKGEIHGARRVTKKSLAFVYFDGPRTKIYVNDESENPR